MNARNVVVKKLAPSKSRIQLLDGKTKNNFLQNLDVGEFAISGDIGVIEKPEKDKEDIFIPGPLKTELEVQLDGVTGHPVNISYTYAVLKENVEKVNQTEEMEGQIDETKRKHNETLSATSENSTYSWEFLMADGKCSSRCDGGTQETPAVSRKFCIHYR